MKIETRLTFKKSTKGTHVYACSEAENLTAPITSVYIKRHALPTPPPVFITLTIEDTPNA